MLTQKIWQMAQIGAEWVLYVLLILSVISIAIMIERTFYFWRMKLDLDIMRRLLRKSLERGGPQHAITRFQESPHVQTTILREALEVAHEGANAAEERATGSRSVQKYQLERGLVFLGTLGNNAPFIGLFGTVLGIINAFRDLSGTQLQLAGGKIMGSISEALVATAVGLLVALPAVVAFNVFQRRVKGILTEADVLLHDLLAYLRRDNPSEITFASPDMDSSGESVASLRLSNRPPSLSKEDSM